MTSLPEGATRHGPGFLVCATVGIAAQFLSDHYGTPAMLMALLLGIAFHFLAEDGRCVSGIDFTAKKVLRFGVALLGVRISVDLLLALLTGGSVTICGASAAMPIAAVLPKNQFSERNLIFTVLSVTVLSTMAIIAYPLITSTLGLDHRATGGFLGGTIHDVAQVVGAGFSVSEETGETATLTKLIRVTMLAPVVLVFSLAFRNMPSACSDRSKRLPLIPGFVVDFLALATLNSFGLMSERVVSTASDVSRWALLLGIAAVGMKTALKSIFDLGREAVILIVAETLFLAIFILIGMHYLG
ncbi:putative sulfate exporter family transporter [Mesorhizobium sp. B2-6-5]|uniref:YeiH family protein n=1 Tax=Mesorhizobium sp. B2-6-5 TaxID=2589912 RepID=UPI001AEE6C04|nr:putative sulfate exporter family transporter [Mesorhizobium sp. B2-6-5]